MAALRVALRGKWFPAAGAAPAKHALAAIAFTVAAGETVALTGPSGCGKTTLLNLVAGLDGGLDGVITRPPGRLAYVFQEPRLLPWRTVADNLRLVLAPDPGREARIARALAEVGLEDAADVFASRLSLGMARRVALARAFVVAPTLVLLDEPFVSLDEATASRLRRLVLDLLDRHATTALFVTHDLREAAMLGHRILRLSAPPGRLEDDIAVPLDPARRRDPHAVAAFLEGLRAAGRLTQDATAQAADAA